MVIVSRASWGAKAPTKPRLPTTLPWPRLWLHATAGARGGAAVMRSTQRYHQQVKGWRDLAYNFGVGDDGVYEGMGLYRHLNEDAGGSGTIVLLGNFETGPLPAPMVERTAWLVAHGWLSGWWQHPRLDGGHRDQEPTACPGRHAYAQIPTINARASQILAQLTPPPPPQQEEDDMKRWIVRAPTGAVYLFDGATLRPANDQTYRDILVYHGAQVPPGGSWFNWSQAQIDSVPVAT